MPCSCLPCPANQGRECTCGLFWFEKRRTPKKDDSKEIKVLFRATDEPHCGQHDPKRR